MNIYSKAFHQLIEQDEELAIDQDAEMSAAQDTVDDGNDVSDLGAVEAPTDSGTAAAEAIAANNAEMTETLVEWINTLDEFVEYLNSTDGDSVQSKLKNAVPDTLFDKIKSSEMKKISRVSMEVAGLKEILRGYLATADDPKLRGV